ncbi:DUF748 domain-containing protein [Aquabacterium sp.]|uniref:DUF748 domain-containing protein n=1 Tax=Aquabacterium sp. TaxID=1872578 RepID=UPI003BB01F37
MTRPDSAPSVAPAARWRAWLKPLAGVAAVAAAWTGVVGMWLPDWARPRIEAAATEALGTPVTIAAVRIQPWTLAVEVDGVTVGPQAAPWFTLKQAQTQLSLASVRHLAPVIRRVQLTEPMFWLERQSADQFNISPVMARLLTNAPEPDGEPARFAVFNIEVRDGLLRYTDRVLKQEHRVEQLQVGVPFVSNLPSDIAVDVQPRLQARIDGSPLKIEGKTLPFQEGHRSEVQLAWQSVDVAHWLTAAQPFLPPSVKITPQQGQLDTNLTVQFEQRPAPAVPMLRITGGLQLSKLGLGLPQAPGLGQVDTGWQLLKVEGLDALPLEKQVRVASVSLDGLHLKARPLAGGAAAPAGGAATPGASAASPVAVTPESSAASTASGTSDAAPEGRPSDTPWQWSVGTVRIAAQAIDVQTADTPWPRLDRVVLDVKGLDAAAKAPAATWQLDVADQHGMSLRASGQAQVARQQVEAKLALDQASVQPWLAPLAQSLSLPLAVQKGALSLQAQLSARLQADPAATSPELAQPGLNLSGGSVRLAGLQTQATASGVRDQVHLTELAVEGADAHLSLDPAQPGLRRMSLETVTVNGLDARVTRGRQGQWLGMAPPRPASAAARRTSAKPQEAALPPVTVKLLRCQDCRVQVTDQTVSPAALLSLQRTDLSVENASADLRQPLTVDLRTQAQGKGQVNFQGEVRPQPLSVQGKVGVAGVDLRVLQSYLDPHLNIRIAGARAQADGRVQLQDDARRGLSVRYQGRVGLSDLRLQDRVNEADFVSWRTLSLDGTDLDWANGQVNANLGRIALSDFFGRVIINPDGQLNLAAIASREVGAQPKSITTPQPAGAASAPAAPVVASAPASAALPTTTAASPMKLRWQGIKLSKGRIDFTDNFIKPNYSANLTRIEGTISAVASDKPEPATVDVAGAVDDGAPLKITGQLHPLGPRLYTDIQGSAKGIELTRLTPYAARYAGYAIEKGSLSMTVHYKIDGGKLEAQNQIYLDQLTFGEKVDSPDATKLPVLFAVSLLKNRHGVIDINLPISGSLDDPQFSVGGIIWRVIVNLITKAVMAPFSLLSGGGDELGFVPFAPGSAELSEAARARLDTLASKLDDRPALKLEATGRADPAVDVAGLRAAHVDRLMRAAKAKAQGQPVDEVKISPEEKSQWLTAAYKAADIKKPRNLVGLAKTLPPAEMEALLQASAPVNDAALKSLADHRGDAVKAYLSSKIPPERVLLTASKVGTGGLPDDKGPSSRVQFDLK